MKVKLMFFATLRDRAGTKGMDLELPDGMTVKALKDKIASDYPGLKQSMEMVLIAVNREYAFDEAVIPAAAEIAMFPPVSGGRGGIGLLPLDGRRGSRSALPPPKVIE
jgi:molybdopterin synthase catalytic subunit